MAEGILCNRKTINAKEALLELLTDKSGKQYYEEMNQLDVKHDALWETIRNT